MQLAYMVREDWGQYGTTMTPQSAVIRAWLNDLQAMIVVNDVSRHTGKQRPADVEAAEYLFPGHHRSRLTDISSLAKALRPGVSRLNAAIILHPYTDQDLELLAEIAAGAKLSRLFVLIWSPEDIVRLWLEARQATDLHTGAPASRPNPLMVEAARMMGREAYNGLSGGRGKDIVVQLVRAFTARGYPLDESSWVRAYFAADGDFYHAKQLQTLVTEMRNGHKHRVKSAVRDDVFDLLQERAADKGKDL